MPALELSDLSPAPRIERGEVMSIFSHLQQRSASIRQERLIFPEYPELFNQDKRACAGAERTDPINDTVPDILAGRCAGM